MLSAFFGLSRALLETFRVKAFRFGVSGLRENANTTHFRVLGFRVQGLGVRAQGLGFRDLQKAKARHTAALVSRVTKQPASS